MLRIAAAEDLTALTRLRRAATGDSAEDAAGWLQGLARTVERGGGDRGRL